MFSNELFNNLAIITLLLIFVIAALQMVSFIVLKTAPNEKKSKIKKSFFIANLTSVAIAVIFSLIFVFFINNNQAIAKREVQEEGQLITPAKVPDNFKKPTKDDVKITNNKSVTAKVKKVQQEATDANNKAMKDAINIFKKAK